MVCCSRKAWLIATGVGALVFLTLGAVFQPMIDAIVRDVVDSQVSLLSYPFVSIALIFLMFTEVSIFFFVGLISSSIYRTWTALRCRS